MSLVDRSKFTFHSLYHIFIVSFLESGFKQGPHIAFDSCLLSLFYIWIFPPPPFCSCNLFKKQDHLSSIVLHSLSFAGGIPWSCLKCFYGVSISLNWYDLEAQSRCFLFCFILFWGVGIFHSCFVYSRNHIISYFSLMLVAIDDHCLEPIFHYRFANWQYFIILYLVVGLVLKWEISVNCLPTLRGR